MRFAVSLIALLGICMATTADEAPELRVIFGENPAIGDNQCNPLVRYELDSQKSQLSIQTTIEMDGQRHISNIILKRKEDGLTAEKAISGFSPAEASCGQIDAKLIDVRCGDPDTFVLSACPMSVSVDGEEVFGSFESLL